MRIIPEYEPVGRLYLSFVREFFHSRFNYGKAIAEIARVASDLVEIEVFVSRADTPFFMDLLRDSEVEIGEIRLNHDPPRRAIVAEYFPVFCEDSGGRGSGILFRNDSLDLCSHLHGFARRVLESMDLAVLEMDESFATAKLSVNENLVLISETMAKGDAGRRRMDFFRRNFPSQEFVPVPALAGDLTEDLDMFLWPLKPGIWIVSQYPQPSEQEASIVPSLRAIEEHGHSVIRIPGLERVAFDDVNTMPNYANGLLLNGTALYPAYGRMEDDVVHRSLEEAGLEPFPIDCSEIILSNSALHCISKTVPRSITNAEEK